MAGATARYTRTHRLLTAEQYRRVFQRCDVKTGDRFMTVLALRNGLQYPRLGTAISVRNAGNAVSRNRIKRLVRESFRLHQKTMGGWDVVVLARPGITARSNQQLFSAMENHWRTIAAHAHTGTDSD